MDVSLVMFKSDGTRRDFPLRGDKVVLGRTGSCDLRIPLSSVSRKHCEFQVKNQTLLLRDLGSSNGTFHNGSRVQEARVLPGDEVAVGPVRFTIVIDGKPTEIKPPQPKAGHGADTAEPDDSGPMNGSGQLDLGDTTSHTQDKVAPKAN